MGLQEYKAEEIDRLKEQITELRISQNNFKERLVELSSQNNNHFDRLFREIEKVQKTMEGINHLTLQITMQVKSLNDHDKKIALMEREIKDTIVFDTKTREMIKEHAIQERTALKVVGVVFAVVQTAVIFLMKYLQ
ncbi:MAG TPA: hypothetical protein PK131_02325 [Candidatus Woesebacteria bacterium]|nr:hypothetical protein [Candidatus Woesebacteria bacterium]